MPVPQTNPLTPEKSLSTRSFFDKRLSADSTVACATCHDPKRSLGGAVVARGIHNADGTRNSPALINRGYGATFCWMSAFVAGQVLEPISIRKWHFQQELDLERRSGMKSADVAAALASYVRSIRSGDWPFDDRCRRCGTLDALGPSVMSRSSALRDVLIGPNFTMKHLRNPALRGATEALRMRPVFASGQREGQQYIRTPRSARWRARASAQRRSTP